MSQRVVVVAAVITPAGLATDASMPIQADAPVLLSQRRQGKHLAGYWEFPGGQVDAGESEQAALSRELQEELGIRVHTSTPWCSLTHHYPEKTVMLKLYRVLSWSGVPIGVEGQAIEWVPWKDVPSRRMPPADVALLKLFGFSPYYYCAMVSPDLFEKKVVALAGKGSAHWPWLIQYPKIECSDDRMADRHRSHIREFQSMGHACLYEGLPQEASALGAQGVHLSAAMLARLAERPTDFSLVAASCHDQTTLRSANRLGVDFVVIPSHLSAAKIQALINNAEMPVFVVSNQTQDGLYWSRDLGGFGVAVGSVHDQGSH